VVGRALEQRAAALGAGDTARRDAGEHTAQKIADGALVIEPHEMLRCTVAALGNAA